MLLNLLWEFLFYAAAALEENAIRRAAGCSVVEISDGEFSQKKNCPHTGPHQGIAASDSSLESELTARSRRNSS